MVLVSQQLRDLGGQSAEPVVVVGDQLESPEDVALLRVPPDPDLHLVSKVAAEALGIERMHCVLMLEVFTKQNTARMISCAQVVRPKVDTSFQIIKLLFIVNIIFI